jgi:hypothetical protein
VGTLAFVPPLLRYGVFELSLVQPLVAGFWRAPDPEASAERTFESAYRESLRRDPRALRAPAAWRVEIVLLAGEAVEWTWRNRQTGLRSWLAWFGPLAPALDSLSGYRTMAERAAARRLDLPADAAPRPRMLDALLVMFAILTAADPARRLRRLPPTPPPPWTFALAAQLVRAFNRRRSWRRAYAAARASQDLSSASSRTSGVCAPETP